jgi:hypothetical protein
VFVNNSVKQSYLKICRWLRDSNNHKEVCKSHRPPDYGAIIDKELYDQIIVRINNGLQIDVTMMRFMLSEILKKHGKEDMCSDPKRFGESWARRFRQRWKLSCRRVTTKMREQPSDFEAKKVYVNKRLYFEI